MRAGRHILAMQAGYLHSEILFGRVKSARSTQQEIILLYPPQPLRLLPEARTYSAHSLHPLSRVR
uniref:Uncharacterized protein n=1 Tax=Picea glauca TaxID=3330 RepID=A0A117NGJ3_PICGL|nr:hypothetical protein ABT39_MTgene6338 [Picea glauca]